MAIIKSKHASNFTVIPNEIFKQGLSPNAIGVLVYLLSLPHDWIVYKTLLHVQLDCSKNKVREAFDELTKSGYVLSVRKFNDKGHAQYEHVVYDRPFNGEPASTVWKQDDPESRRQLLDVQQLGRGSLQSTNPTKKTIPNIGFEVFWSHYNKKVGDKAKCQKKWEKLSDVERTKIMAVLPAFLGAIKERQYIPFPETFLSKRRWEDEVETPKTVMTNNTPNGLPKGMAI